jgi:hypothetical protein
VPTRSFAKRPDNSVASPQAFDVTDQQIAAAVGVVTGRGQVSRELNIPPPP